MTLFSASLLVFIAASSATTNHGTDDTTPTQLHLAIAGAYGMRAAWKTNVSAASLCSFGLSPTTMNTTVNGTSASYLPGFGYHHVAKMAPLASDQTYYYSCGSTGAMSTVNSFRSSPAGPNNFSMAIFGDWGWLNSTARWGIIPVDGLDTNWSASLTHTLLTDLVAKKAISSVWLVGDLGYADDGGFYLPELASFEYENVTDGFFSWFEPFASTIPFQVSVGNHESECHDPLFCILGVLDTYGNSLKNFTAFNHRWHMPSPESGGVLNMWHSWDYGSVHFVSLNCETDFFHAPEENSGDSGLFPAGHFAPDGAYLAWLEADLKAAASNPSVTWIIAGGHRMWDSFNSTMLPAMFDKYGVDLYVGGHGHSYARYDGSQWATNFSHIMVGSAGCDSMPYPRDQAADASALAADRQRVLSDPQTACETWCADPRVRAAFAGHGRKDPREAEPCIYCEANPVFVSDKMSIGVLDVTEAELTWKLLRSPDGAVLDTLTIRK